MSCDIAVCCQADLRTDSDNDGDIDEDDEAVEDQPPGVIFPVNSDDDNGNGTPDMDENPVFGDDDLVEMQLSTTCNPTDPGSALWSLSGPISAPAVLRFWEDSEKHGTPIEDGVQYAWPPPASVWAEALDTFEADVTFTIWVDDTRAQKKDKVKATVSCTFGHKYAYAENYADATGCSARILTRMPNLCGPTHSGNRSLASSNAWAGVADFAGGTLQKSAQFGYEAHRNQGYATFWWCRYAETKYGPGTNDVDYYSELGVPSGTHEYKCYLISSLFGTWRYEYDGVPFHQFTHNGWRGATGTVAQWVGEIFNKEDQMVGTASAKCEFTQCQYSANWGMSQDANITTGCLHTDDPSEWGIERVSSTALNIWDKNP